PRPRRGPGAREGRPGRGAGGGVPPERHLRRGVAAGGARRRGAGGPGRPVRPHLRQDRVRQGRGRVQPARRQEGGVPHAERRASREEALTPSHWSTMGAPPAPRTPPALPPSPRSTMGAPPPSPRGTP